MLASLSPSINEKVLRNKREEEKSFTDELQDRLRRNDTSPIVVDGYVTSKRSIGKHLAFLDFQVDRGSNQKTDDDNHNLCQALLRKDVYTGDFHDGYRRCLLKGCKFRLTGVASPTRIPGNVVLMLHSVELLALPHQAQHIQIILQQAVDGSIPFNEAVQACSAAQQNLLDLEERLFSLHSEPTTGPVEMGSERDIEDDRDSMIEMQRRKITSRRLERLAKDILGALPHDPQYPVAADQRALSREGNFMIPPAPDGWKTVPKELKRDIDNETKNYHNLTTTSRVKDTLLELSSLVNSNDDTHVDKMSAQVSITGWVQNRRRFDGNITMIYIVDNLSHAIENENSTNGNFQTNSVDRLPCLVHPDMLRRNGQERSGVYQNLIGSGSNVRVEGRILFPATTEVDDSGCDSESETKATTPLFLWVQNIQLARSSYRSVNIRHLLDLLYQKQIDPKEASEALLISSEDANELSLQSDPTQRQWKANLFAVQLQKEASFENNLMRKVDPALLKTIEKYRYLSKIHPVIATAIEEDKSEKDCDRNETNSFTLLKNTISNDAKDFVLDERKQRRIGMGMPGSKWQIKKKPQLVWMGKQIREVLESHPDFKKRKLTILDIGGGRGALANYLGQNLGHHIQVHVVDISQNALRNGKRKAERLDLPVDFQFADASNSNLLDAVDADIVVALHACGHLSDVALNHAMHRQAGFVIVPCCFNSNPHLMIPSSSSGNDETTTLTPVHDWLGLPASDWSALKLLAEVQDDIPLASEAIGILCAIRAEAVQKRIRMAIDEEGNYDNSTSDLRLDRAVEIKSFPIQYSTRNTVLVGKCS